MISEYKKKIAKMFSFFTGRSKSFNTEKDWKIILLVTLFLFVSTLIFHTIFFFQVKNETIFRSNIVVAEDTLEVDIQRLDEALMFFEAKEHRFEEIRKNSSALICER